MLLNFIILTNSLYAPKNNSKTINPTYNENHNYAQDNDIQLYSHAFDNPLLSSSYPVLSSKIQTNIDNISEVLDHQLSDINRNIKNKIIYSIENNTLDRNKFRDIFIVKKTEFLEGEKKIVKYDIDEKIIPKYSSITYNIIPDKPTKILLIFIFILLFSLVLTTTLKLYDNLRRVKRYCINKVDENYN